MSGRSGGWNALPGEVMGHIMVGGRREQLNRLYLEVQGDQHYRNEAMGVVFVPGAGNPQSTVVLVGEAPGREEEIRRRPFVGSAGTNLDTLLRHISWTRDDLFITNLIKYRPLTAQGGNRKPSLKEGRYALSYLIRELAILEPQLVVCLGSSAASVLLGQPGLKMASVNGREIVWNNRTFFVTYHPSPLNYNNPQRHREMLEAFERLRDIVAV
jgi:uracil-DNA glycosylase